MLILTIWMVGYMLFKDNNCEMNEGIKRACKSKPCKLFDVGLFPEIDVRKPGQICQKIDVNV